MQKGKIGFEIVYAPPLVCFLGALNLSSNLDDIWDVGSSCIGEDSGYTFSAKKYIASY